MPTLPELNAFSPERFAQALGGVFEHSAWVAQAAEPLRPFADVEALHAAMALAVERAGPEAQIRLLCAHPELAGKEAQAGEMTASSQTEQSSAGLNALTPDELARLTHLNGRYRQKFGFPFIIAVRNHTKQSIFSELERRVANDRDAERRNALAEVYAITRLRLDALTRSS